MENNQTDFFTKDQQTKVLKDITNWSIVILEELANYATDHTLSTIESEEQLTIGTVRTFLKGHHVDTELFLDRIEDPMVKIHHASLYQLQEAKFIKIYTKKGFEIFIPTKKCIDKITPMIKTYIKEFFDGDI